MTEREIARTPPDAGVSAVTTMTFAPAAVARRTSDSATPSSDGQYSWYHQFSPDSAATSSSRWTTRWTAPSRSPARRRPTRRRVPPRVHHAEDADRRGEHRCGEGGPQHGHRQVAGVRCAGPAPHPGNDPAGAERVDVPTRRAFRGRTPGDVREGGRGQRLARPLLETVGRHRQVGVVPPSPVR